MQVNASIDMMNVTLRVLVLILVSSFFKQYPALMMIKTDTLCSSCFCMAASVFASCNGRSA